MSDLAPWLVAAAMRGTLVLSLIYIATRLLRGRLNPAQEHTLWLAGLASFFVPVGYTWQVDRDVVVTPDMVVEHLVHPGAAAAWTFSWQDVAIAAWLVGGCVLAVRLAMHYWRLRARVNAMQPLAAHAPLAVIAAGLAHDLGVRQYDVRVGRGGEPFSVGLLRPTIVLPSGLSEPEASAVMAHEMAHLARRDLWSGWLEAVVRVVFFVSPLVYIASRRMALLRELCCDAAAVTRGGVSGAEFASLLLQRATATCGAHNSHQSVAMAMSHSQPSALAMRVKQLLGERPRGMHRAGPIWGVAAALLVVASLRIAERDRYVASDACIYTPAFAQNLLASYPEADADNDGVLSRNEACDWQAGWRKDGRGPEGADRVATLLNPQTLCCNCSQTTHNGGPTEPLGPNSSSSDAPPINPSVPAADVLFVGRPTC